LVQANFLYSFTRDAVLQGRSLAAFISPLLRADAKSYTTAQEFLDRNQTFFATSLKRPSLDQRAPVPIAALHTAAAALCLVPESHWNIETHRFNVTSYSGAGAFDDTHPSGSTGAVDTSVKVAEDKLFKRELYHYLRWALSAGAPGPGIPETLAILGRAESVRRLEEARRLTAPMQTNAGRRQPKGVPPAADRDDNTTWMGSLAPR
jgi:glutamyl-tRNA synthetase